MPKFGCQETVKKKKIKENTNLPKIKTFFSLVFSVTNQNRNSHTHAQIEYQVELKILRTLKAKQITNLINSFGNRIIKIADDRNPKAFIEKLNHSVRANETGSFDNQNRLFREISMERMREKENEREYQKFFAKFY